MVRKRRFLGPPPPPPPPPWAAAAAAALGEFEAMLPLPPRPPPPPPRSVDASLAVRLRLSSEPEAEPPAAAAAVVVVAAGRRRGLYLGAALKGTEREEKNRVEIARESNGRKRKFYAGKERERTLKTVLRCALAFPLARRIPFGYTPEKREGTLTVKQSPNERKSEKDSGAIVRACASAVFLVCIDIRWRHNSLTLSLSVRVDSVWGSHSRPPTLCARPHFVCHSSLSRAFQKDSSH